MRDGTRLITMGSILRSCNLRIRRIPAAARQTAPDVLDYCAKAALAEARVDPWRLATEGEANLILGKTNEAIEHYRASLQAQPSNWKRNSTYQQAVLLVGLVGDRKIAEELDAVFRKG